MDHRAASRSTAVHGHHAMMETTASPALQGAEEADLHHNTKLRKAAYWWAGGACNTFAFAFYLGVAVSDGIEEEIYDIWCFFMEIKRVHALCFGLIILMAVLIP